MINWHPFPNETPFRDGYYLITTDQEWSGCIVEIGFYSAKSKSFSSQDVMEICEVVAWAELPEPYDTKWAPKPKSEPPNPSSGVKRKVFGE